MAHAKGIIGTTDYATAIITGRHSLTADEPPALGGADAGPAPYDLLVSSLAACTAITLRMYAQRKGWDLKGAQVDVHYGKTEDGAAIQRTLILDGDLTEDQRKRLADIAERTPVTLTLRAGVPITTELK